MKKETWNELESQFVEFPITKGRAATPDEVDAASRALDVLFPGSLREFLLRYGAAIVGPYPIFGVTPVEPMGTMWSIVEVNRDYRSKEWPGVEEWLIVSRDHAGNPIGIRGDGEVWVSDHGTAFRLAKNFEEFLRKRCLSADC